MEIVVLKKKEKKFALELIVSRWGKDKGQTYVNTEIVEVYVKGILRKVLCMVRIE